MTGDATVLPLLQVLGDDDAASCDPVSGACALPAAPGSVPGPSPSAPPR